MTGPPLSAPPASGLPRGGGAWRLPLTLSIALRELRSGPGGFYIFIACVALGVMVIAAVGSLSDSLRSGFERQGEMILGGDITFARMHTRASPEERTWFDSHGSVSEAATLRTMARRLDGSDQILTELKGVDAAYPLAGRVILLNGRSLSEVLRTPDAVAVEPILLERLRVSVGDRIRVGSAEVVVVAVIAAEPDRLADRLTYGPRVLMSLETLERTGLAQPGAMMRWRYALDLPGTAGSSGGALQSLRAEAAADLPEAGFTITDRRDPAPQVTRTLERLRQFLTLIGLTALCVGGVGVANAVTTFVDRRRRTIATFKSVGASNRRVFRIFLTQILVMAGLGILAGVITGIAIPWLIDALYGHLLPFRLDVALSWTTLLLASVYGLLVALLFTLWPLGRAEFVSPAVLFRDDVSTERVWPRAAIVAMTIAVALGIVGLATLTSDSPRIAGVFCAALVGVLIAFLGLGAALSRIARLLPRPRRPELALAIGSLGAPGGLMRSVVLSLGVGLTVLVIVALINTSIVAEFTERAPQRSPNYFLLDIAKADYAGVEAVVRQRIPDALFLSAPMLRGRLVRLKETSVDTIKAPPEAEWVLNGDRGLSYSEGVPDGSRVIKGDWWPKDYSGEPLVSFEADLAEKLGLEIGDTVTVNVLGRNVTARISNLREVKWQSLAINFVMVFSPNTLRAAPYTMLATITLPPRTSLTDEAAIARDLGASHPMVTAVRVKDALDAANAILAKVLLAVQVAGSITLIAGALVLAGALATAQRRRIVETAVLKALGATSGRIVTAHLIEYGLLGGVTAVLALALGTLVAWTVAAFLLTIPFVFSWGAVLQAMGVALALVVGFGVLGTWRILLAPTVPNLRSA